MTDEDVGFRATKRKRNFEAKKMVILREAAQLFATNGVNQTSLDDIANRLNISKPALYYYVKSKDEIISECLALAHENDVGKIAEIGSLDCPGLQKFTELVKYYGHNVIDDFGKCLVLVDLNALSEESREKHRESQRFLLGASRRFLREGIKDGSVKPCNETIITFTVVGALNSIAHWFQKDGPSTISEVVDQIIDSFVDGIKD